MFPGPLERPQSSEAVFWPTTQEILSWRTLGLSLVTGREQIGTPVRIVLATELLDPQPYLRGGEMLLTTGMAWTSDRAAADFVQAAARAGVSAVGFGTGPWSDHVSPSLIAAARRAGLPLLEVPPATPFMAVAELVADEQAHRRADHAQHVMLGALMDHIRRGQADAVVLEDHAPFLARENLRVAAACHAEDAGIVEPLHPQLLVGRRDGRITVVGQEEEVRHHLDSRGITVYGWGDPATVRDLRRLLAEAWSACDVALQRGGPAAAQDLATLGGLLARLTPEQLAPFADHVIRPLRRHDAAHGTDLLRTVETFVRMEGSLAQTGEAMYLHINTVRKRMARVGSLLGIDAAVPEGYLALRLAAHSLGARGQVPQ